MHRRWRAVVLLVLGLLACGASELRNRVLLVGFDGATLRVIEALQRRGRLPHLTAIALAGVAGSIRSESPSFSPRIWNSIATSKPPAEHGIEGWVWFDASRSPRLYASSDRKVHALWNIASDAGLRVGVVNWLNTHPPEKLNGVMISDHLLPGAVELEQEVAHKIVAQSTSAGKPVVSPVRHVSFAFPEAWLGKLLALREGATPLTPIPDPFEREAARMPGVPGHLSRLYRDDELVARAALAVESELHPDLLMVYFPGIDKVSHLLWGSLEDPALYPPELRGTPEERAARERALQSYYEFSDALLGRLLERYAPSDLVIVVSDHGFEAGVPAEGMTGTHVSQRASAGILFARGRGVRAGVDTGGASIFDVTPSVLAWLGLPVGRDMRGRGFGFLEAQAVAQVATHDGGVVERLEGPPSGVENDILEELRALGYVE